MIRHICMFKYKEENKENNIKETFVKAEMLREIPQIKKFEIVRNVIGTPDSNYEVSLIFDFDTIEELETYQADQRHVEFGNFIKSVREARACIDYEI